MEHSGEYASQRVRQRRLRALRGTGAALVAVLFAATAHTLAGGTPPPPWLVVAVTLLVAPACVALVGRRRSIVRLGAAVSAAQLALHAAFAVVGGAAPTMGTGGHVHALDLAALVPGAGAAVDPAAATMTFGHALAALATWFLLAWGERAAAAVVRGIRRLLARPVGRMPAAQHVVDVTPVRASAALPAVFLSCVIRRGPPALTAPASA